jgi:hypothetical protein
MATKNPRVVSYIDPDDHEKLQQFMKQYGVTESKAIAHIVKLFFGGELPSTLSTPVAPERIEAIEQQLAELSGKLNGYLERDTPPTHLVAHR